MQFQPYFFSYLHVLAWADITEYRRLDGLSNRCYCSQLWRLKVCDQGAGTRGSWWSLCLVCSGREGERSPHSSCKGINLIHEGPALMSSWPSNAVPPNRRLDSSVLFCGDTNIYPWHGSSPSVHQFTFTPQLRKVTASPHSH